MMASSLPLVMTGLHSSSSTSNDGPLNWCAWAHQGHRLWVNMPDSFWVFTYKVERCPFSGNHVWLTCPYAHKGERARRRDPRIYPYVAAPCPEYAESKRRLQLARSSAAPTCPRGIRCGYTHNIFETWLHPTKFRTVMCDRGAGCPRNICFFAHSIAQRRREDDEVPLVVFSATQTPAAAFVPRAPRLAAPASLSSSSGRSRSVSVVITRPIDRVTEAVQQGHTVRLLTRRFDAAGASSSASLAAVATAASATAPVPLSTPPLQASPSPVDDEDMDFVAIVTSCCLASEADSNAEGSGFPHFDRLIMDNVRR